jgi:ADP-ribosylglycohydrolase
MNGSRHAATYEAGGEGALLGAAAGDMLVSGTRRAYGATVQQMVFTAYHLLRSQPVEAEAIATQLLEFAYPPDGRVSVYRSPSPWLAAFIDEAKLSPPTPMPFSNAGAAIRAVPIGVWFRKEPESLIKGAIAAVGATHTRPESSIVGSVVAGMVAAAGYGQSGRDLVNGAVEVARRTERTLEVSTSIPAMLADTAELIAGSAKDVSAEVLSWGANDTEVEVIAMVVALASRAFEEASVVVRNAAGVVSHADAVAPLVGAVVGARSGLHKWPWPLPNDLWFAELGRRLARRKPVVEDLPDPYAVEEVLNYELATDTLVER